MLQTLQENKLYAKLSRCEFWLGEVSFLSHVISSGGITTNSSKIDVVLQWETPISVTKIISFLSLDGSYRTFIEGFLKLAFTLTHLTQKGQAFLWNVQCEACLQELKKKLTSTSILIFSSPSKSFVVYFDAYKMSLSGVHMHNG